MAKTTSNKVYPVRFVAYITDKNGVRHYASEYGKKAFPIPLVRKKTKKA